MPLLSVHETHLVQEQGKNKMSIVYMRLLEILSLRSFSWGMCLMAHKFLNILQFLSNGRTIKTRYKNYISLRNCLHFSILPSFSSIVLYKIYFMTSSVIFPNPLCFPLAPGLHNYNFPEYLRHAYVDFSLKKQSI